MKKLIFTIFATSVVGFFVPSVNAQMMGDFSNTTADWDKIVEHTAREEKEGKEIWEKFQAKEISCADLNDEQFGALGEYFMGQMMGDSHASMNAMMMQMYGEDGEEQMHIVMGKRLSGCDASASVTGMSNGWMPMMNMMMERSSNSMMENWGQNPMGGIVINYWLRLLLWFVWLVAGILASVWLWKQIAKK